MAEIRVRLASLDDTQSISALFRARVTRWQRLNAAGQVEDVPYESLSIYERWLHGGPWMSVETAALHLSHLLRGAGLPIVALVDGRIGGYVEAFHGLEPEPFGSHLHIVGLTLRPDCEPEALADALLTYSLEQARQADCARLTTAVVPHDDFACRLYERQGLARLARVVRVSLPARTGQVFYRAAEHLSANPTQISGWHMPVGRLTSARHQWETLWPRTWHAIPELRARRAHRLKFSVAGQEALVYCEQQLYAPRSADVACWSPKPLSTQVLTALRDWAHHEGYRTLVMVTAQEVASLLGPDAEPDGFVQDIYAAAAQ